MELQEMKNVWASVDARLKENEMLNKRIVQEMLHKKSNKSLSWLFNYEMIGVIVPLLAIPLLVYYYNLHSVLFVKSTFVVIIAFCILGAIWNWYKLKSCVMKIDFSKSVKDNLYHVNKYNILLKKEKMGSYFVALPILSLFATLSYYKLNASFHLWTFLVVALIIAVASSYWTYKKIYEKNIQSIKKNLEELEELKEE